MLFIMAQFRFETLEIWKMAIEISKKTLNFRKTLTKD